MLIDWLTLRVPVAHHAALAMRLQSCIGLYQRVNADSELVEERPYLDIDALRSDTVGICWQVNTCPENGRMLVIGASPASLEHGCNVFGSMDIKHCAQVLINAAEDAINKDQTDKIRLPALYFWQCRRIDVTENYAFQTVDQVKEALRALRGADAPRSRAFIMGGDTVGWNKGSDRRSGKAYHKGPQLERLFRKGQTTASEEEIELAHRMLRLELKIGSRFFREEFRDYMIEKYGPEGQTKQWHQLTMDDMSKWHEQYFAQFFGALEVTDMNQDLLTKLRECRNSKGEFITENQALAAFNTWLRIKQIGYDQTKASMPRATWFRHARYLKDCGLSQADLCSAQILPFRKRSVLLRPVQSWDCLRRVA